MHDGQAGDAQASLTPCPNGCGQNVNPRGRGSHNRSCPALAKKGGDNGIRLRIEVEAANCLRAIRVEIEHAESQISDIGEPCSELNEVSATLVRITGKLDEREKLLSLLA